MKNQTYAKGMALLSSIFGNLDLSEEKLKILRPLLYDLNEEQFLGATEIICRETKEIYPGTNIVALIREKALGSKIGLQAQAIMAWEAVRIAIERYGSYQSIQFDDPVIHSCIESLGGWIRLCQTDIGEMVWQEKKFKELYGVFVMRKGVHPKQLVGRIKKENTLNGYTEPMSYAQLDSRFEQFNPIPDPIWIDTGHHDVPYRRLEE